MGKCAIGSCPKPTPPDVLMCARHWKMVPGDVQTAVYRAWRGAGQDNVRALMSQEWHDAVDEACQIVMDRERHDIAIGVAGTCAECDQVVNLTKSTKLIRRHGPRDAACPGSARAPKEHRP